MISLRKIFRLPGPKDLKMSDSNFAMPSKYFSFGNPDNSLTWEDYENKLKYLFPVRYFLTYTLVYFFKYKIYIPITAPISKFIYFLKCHFLPSYKFHLIDIRQPSSSISKIDQYKYGWIDVAQKMLLANFSLLDEALKEHYLHCPTQEEIDNTAIEQGKEILIRSRDTYLEAKALSNWWNIERKIESRAIDDLSNQWYILRKSKDEKASILNEQISQLEISFANKEDEMLIRLMKIRKYLWS